MENESHIQLVRLIQRGAIAMVWEGFDARLERKVLVKQIHEHIALDEELRSRFEREARAVARLKPHPNVVQVYELTRIGTQLAIVMEFVEGISLAKLVAERGPMPVEIAATILIEILNGLEQIHQVNIVHRDLKPANVLVSNDGEIKITDFGFATLHDQPSHLTMEGAPLGTPAYMAPEQAWGELTGTTTDIFAAGLVMFELLVGRSYVQGDQWQQAFLFMREYKSPRLTPYRQYIPKSLMPVLWRMLRANPAKRFPTASEARDAIAAAVPTAPLPRALVKDFLVAGGVRRPAPKPILTRRRDSQFLRVTVVTILLATLSFMVWRITKEGEQRQTASGIVQDTVRPDSVLTAGHSMDSVSEMITSEQNEDRARVDQPRKERPSLPRDTMPKPVIPDGPGWVWLTCTPYAAVSDSDSLYGMTPLRAPIQLQSGRHELSLRNEEIGFPVVIPVVVEPGETTRVQVSLYDYVGQVRAGRIKPWADVYINEKLRLEAGDARTLFLPFGTYKITLKHPQYPSHTYMLTLRKGDAVHEISVDLTHL